MTDKSTIAARKRMLRQLAVRRMKRDPDIPKPTIYPPDRPGPEPVKITKKRSRRRKRTPEQTVNETT